MLSGIRRLIRNIDQVVWIGILAIAAVVTVALLLLKTDTGTDPQVVELTLSAASTQSNVYVPTLSANLTLTPIDAALTGAAPTLSLAGRMEVRQFAASAFATSERDPLDQGAVQAAGLPNTTECGDFRTAWASAIPNEQAAITLLYPELVTPTGILVYQTYNPGFITRIDIVDIYGALHTVYEAEPQLEVQCPFARFVPVDEADYKANRVTITIDQATSLGGWSQIDAVELIGIRN
jgi:hypothetical protein